MNSKAQNGMPDEMPLVVGTERKLWFLIVGVAVAAGVYFRFLGFSVWPLATDEYYIYRSVAFVLQTGLPEFPCGGFYTRGLIYQYLTAPLLALGASPEASVRLIPILSSLAMLPAAFLLARRVGGLRVASVLVTILALSTWEIEMARFGRMYAPFQAICMWYVYHSYVLVKTGDRRRWRWLLGLSFIAPLVWEGGVTLLLANFLPILTRRTLWRPVHLVSTLVVLASAFVFLQTDFRGLMPATEPESTTLERSHADGETLAGVSAATRPGTAQQPPRAGVMAADSHGGSNGPDVARLPLAALAALADHAGLATSYAAGLSLTQFVTRFVEPFGIGGSLAPDLVNAPMPGVAFAILLLVLIAGLVRLLPMWRSEAKAIAIFLMLTVSVLLNQLFLAVLLFLGACLVNWFRVQDVLLPRYRSVVLPLVGMAVLWVIVALAAGPESSPGLKGYVKSLLPLISFPDLINSFLIPWLASSPLMTVLVLAGTGVTLVRCLFGSTDEQAAIRYLLAFAAASLSIIGIAPLTYLETRYSFHLYPLLILLSLIGLARCAVLIPAARRVIEKWVPPAFLGLFLLSSDFSLNHMLRIDSYEANFRVGYAGIRARHYYSRFDFESPADFVNTHAAPSDLVVTTAVAVTQYLERDSVVFMQRADVRYHLQACDRGRTERWTGLPLIDDVRDIDAIAESSAAARVWLIVDHYASNSVLSDDYLTGDVGYQQVFVSGDKKFKVFRR